MVHVPHYLQQQRSQISRPCVIHDKGSSQDVVLEAKVKKKIASAFMGYFSKFASGNAKKEGGKEATATGELFDLSKEEG